LAKEDSIASLPSKSKPEKTAERITVTSHEEGIEVVVAREAIAEAEEGIEVVVAEEAIAEAEVDSVDQIEARSEVERMSEALEVVAEVTETTK